MVKDFVSSINTHPVKDTRIEGEINHLIEQYKAFAEISQLEEPVDLTELLEFVLEYDLDFQDVKEVFPALRTFDGDILGCTDFEEKRVVIDKTLFDQNRKRANFTIAHEISHIIFHEKLYFREKDQLRLEIDSKEQPSFVCRDYAKSKAIKPIIEQQADKGASFLLLPQGLLLHKWEKEIKPKYKGALNSQVKKAFEPCLIKSMAADFSDLLETSKQALEIRIGKLGIDFFGFCQEGVPRQVSLFG